MISIGIRTLSSELVSTNIGCRFCKTALPEENRALRKLGWESKDVIKTILSFKISQEAKKSLPPKEIYC